MWHHSRMTEDRTRRDFLAHLSQRQEQDLNPFWHLCLIQSQKNPTMIAIPESLQTSIPAFHHSWRLELLPNVSPNVPCYSASSWLLLSPWTGLFLSSSQQPFTCFEDLTMFHVSLLPFKQTIPFAFFRKSSGGLPPPFHLFTPALLSWSVSSLEWDAPNWKYQV